MLSHLASQPWSSIIVPAASRAISIAQALVHPSARQQAAEWVEASSWRGPTGRRLERSDLLLGRDPFERMASAWRP